MSFLNCVRFVIVDTIHGTLAQVIILVQWSATSGWRSSALSCVLCLCCIPICHGTLPILAYQCNACSLSNALCIGRVYWYIRSPIVSKGLSHVSYVRLLCNIRWLLYLLHAINNIIKPSTVNKEKIDLEHECSRINSNLIAGIYMNLAYTPLSAVNKTKL